MTLFANAHDANLTACSKMVEDVLVARGLDPAATRTSAEGRTTWTLRQGSADVIVALTRGSDGPNTIRVSANVVRASAEALAGNALFRRILELNARALQQAAFGLDGVDVVLTTDRSTEGLDLVEVEEMIRRIASYADHFDDALVAEFGGRRSSDL